MKFVMAKKSVSPQLLYMWWNILAASEWETYNIHLYFILDVENVGDLWSL